MSDRLNHNDESIIGSERFEIMWRNHLAEFDEKVWPIFQHYGYTKDTALQVWFISTIHDRRHSRRGNWIVNAEPRQPGPSDRMMRSLS